MAGQTPPTCGATRSRSSPGTASALSPRTCGGLAGPGRPAEVADYGLANAVGDMVGVLDALGVESAHVVGHDWGAAVARYTAMFLPDRVRKLTVLSVGHPRAPRTLRQDEMAWYQLFFQFEGVAEATIACDDWAWLRRFSRGDGDQERYLEDLSRPGALTASLNWYRANLAPRMPGAAPDLPPVQVPTLGIWSTNDHYSDGKRMEKSGAFVEAKWRPRGDRGREPLDPAGRTGPAQRAAPGLAGGLTKHSDPVWAAVPEAQTGLISVANVGSPPRRGVTSLGPKADDVVACDLLQLSRRGPRLPRPCRAVNQAA
jgi:pimeloyl-ACP methyl ester carboxylesterase